MRHYHPLVAHLYSHPIHHQPDLTSNIESKTPLQKAKKIIVRTRAGINAFLTHIDDDKAATKKKKLITLFKSYRMLPQKRSWLGQMFSVYE